MEAITEATINHDEAAEYAAIHQHDSNLARCYLTQAAQIARLKDALNEIACWGQQPYEDGSFSAFDEPVSAECARKALAAPQEGKG